MSEKIDVLEVIDGPSIEELYTLELPIIKDDEQADSENERILKRSQLYWKDYLAEKNYNKDINKMCTICREDQIKAHGKITIPCKGLADISSKYSAEEVKYLEEEVYSKEDMEHIRTIYDPYAFVEKYLDADNIGSPDRRFSPRWYQEMVTKCTAKDKNIRMGRRCIPYYEKVLTKDGYKEISSLSVGTKVKSFNSKTKSFRYSEVTKVINNGVKKVYKLTLKNGKTIECTSNHPILTKYKKGMMWLTLDSGLFIGNKVCYNKRNKVFTSELVDIEYVGEVLTYDISVGEDHTFLVDDIITHNTGKSFALSIVIVHRAVTTTIVGYRILLVSPFKTQTDEVIDNIKGLCQLLGDNPLKSSKASPNHELIFNSGCILKGFTASKEANSIRGQPGHLLVIDEADDMPIKALISILGIRMGQPNVEVWMSGTPKGEKNLFAGDMKPETKSFHYPSFVIPHYDDAMDNNNRSDLGEVGYTQEVIAEYGAVANGVYQDDFLRIAQEREVWITSKDVLTRRSNFIVIIGIDWNGDGVGVRILTVAYDKTRNDFKIVERTEVSLVGRTQDEAVNEVVKANRKYNADHIYGDVGYGHYQLETLKVYGERAFKTTKPGDPDRKLINVVGVEFGKTTDITDHNSGEVYKVPTKQFAVQNSVLLLEKNMIGLHPKEDHAMILQMKNYIEKSRNKGRIVYTTISKKIGDHDLDALIFALYGFKIEYPTIFGKHSMQAMMRFGDRFNPTADPSLLDDIPFVSLSFGGNYVPRHRNNKVRGSRPERVQNIGTIRRRNSFR